MHPLERFLRWFFSMLYALTRRRIQTIASSSSSFSFDHLIHPFNASKKWYFLEESDYRLVPKTWRENLDKFQLKHQLQFNNPTLLKNALVHESYFGNAAINENKDINSISNSALAFLGDSLLSIAVSSYLYQRFPNYNEGQFTYLRQNIVSNATLCHIASTKLGLDEVTLHALTDDQVPYLCPRFLATALEALIAAVYLDQGFEKCIEFVMNFIVAEVQEGIERDVIELQGKDFDKKNEKKVKKTAEFIAICRKYGVHVDYIAVENKDTTWTVEILCNSNVFASGTAPTKSVARTESAINALQLYQENPEALLEISKQKKNNKKANKETKKQENGKESMEPLVGKKEITSSVFPAATAVVTAPVHGRSDGISSGHDGVPSNTGGASSSRDGIPFGLGNTIAPSKARVRIPPPGLENALPSNVPMKNLVNEQNTTMPINGQQTGEKSHESHGMIGSGRKSRDTWDVFGYRDLEMSEKIGFISSSIEPTLEVNAKVTILQRKREIERFDANGVKKLNDETAVTPELMKAF